MTYAQTIDGSIANQDSIIINFLESKCAISCDESLKMTHFLRTEHDCILIGIETLLIDNPSLISKYYEGKSPIPVILDKELKIPIDCRLFNINTSKPIIFCDECKT